jgi:poly(3-hydroxybutyrate) depolymerase
LLDPAVPAQPGSALWVDMRTLALILVALAAAAPAAAGRFAPKRFAVEHGRLVAYDGAARRPVVRVDVTCDVARVTLPGSAPLVLHGSFCTGAGSVVDRLNAALRR